jgi:hypothetical protein
MSFYFLQIYISTLLLYLIAKAKLVYAKKHLLRSQETY